jgi:hypothetical protein
MSISNAIVQIRSFLVSTFADIDKWFDKDIELRSYKPTYGGWTIDQILEHIGLTNHYLLILVEKGTLKALANSNNLNLSDELGNYSFDWERFKEIGIHKSFTWVRPEHMEPTGSKTSEEVRDQIKQQVLRCLESLEKLADGQGILHKTTMTVNGLGKLNVYEYIYFLGQHGLRHIVQMETIQREFQEIGS